MPSKGGGPTKGGGGNQIPPSVSSIFNHGLWVLTPHVCFDDVDIDSEPKSLGRTRNQLTNSTFRPQPRLAFNAPFGGYTQFRSADSQSYNIGTNITDAQSEFFMCALIRMRSGGNFEFGRGRDGAGAGWSIAWSVNPTVIYNAVFIGGFQRDTTYNVTLGLGKWHLVMFAVKQGASGYVKAGLNGVWGSSANITDSTFRSSTDGLVIGATNSPTGNANCDIALVGLGTSVPPDQQLLALNVGIQGAIEPPNPGIDPFIDPGASSSTSSRSWLYSLVRGM